MTNVRTFYIYTLTQIGSLIGSLMTATALGIYLFTTTGSTTPILLASFFGALPLMLGGVFAGVVADRWNRRVLLLVSDAGQAVATLLLLASFAAGIFQIWHLYSIAFLQGVLATLQRPAIEASVTMLVPEHHRDRANTIRQVTGPSAGIIAPVLTGLTYAVVGVIGVLVIDLLTFIVAAVTVYLIHIPQPEHISDGSTGTRSVWREAWQGVHYLWTRRVLFSLMIYAAVN